MFLKKNKGKKAEMSFLVKIISWIVFLAIMIGVLYSLFNKIGVTR